ncbi:hypothetical protein B1A_03986, partial [mine drainage metagenome]
GDKEISAVFAERIKPAKTEDITEKRMIERVEKGTEMLLKDEFSEYPYKDEMFETTKSAKT